MGRKPIVLNHAKALGGQSTNKHSVQRRERDEGLEQWLYDIQLAMQRERGRRLYYKRMEEAGRLSENLAAAKYVGSRLRLVDQVREVLDNVPDAKRNYLWIEKDAWEKEERRVVRMEGNADSNDSVIEEPEDLSKKRKRLLVEIGAPVKRTKLGDHGHQEGGEDHCQSDWSDVEDWGPSDSEFEDLVRPEPDDEGKDEAESGLREIMRKFKEARSKKAESVASWVAKNSVAIEDSDGETDGEYEEIKSSEESDYSDEGEIEGDVGDEDY